MSALRGVAAAALVCVGVGATLLLQRKVPPEGAAPGAVVGTVDGRPVTVAQVASRVAARRAFPDDVRSAALAAPTADEALRILARATDEALVKRAVEQAVDQAIVDGAIANAPPATPDEIEARVARLRKKVERQGGPSLEQIFAHEGGLEGVRRNVAREIALDHVVGAPTDEDLARYFAGHKDVFSGRKVKIAHGLFPTEASAQEAKDELAKGASWDDVIKKRSTDNETRTRGGEIGWAKRTGDLDEALTSVAFSLDKDQVGGPVKSRYGWHLVKWTEEQKGKPIVLDDVKDDVRDAVLGERRRARLEKLRASAKVELKTTK